jgi:hypothetical protein
MSNKNRQKEVDDLTDKILDVLVPVEGTSVMLEALEKAAEAVRIDIARAAYEAPKSK